MAIDWLGRARPVSRNEICRAETLAVSPRLSLAHAALSSPSPERLTKTVVHDQSLLMRSVLFHPTGKPGREHLPCRQLRRRRIDPSQECTCNAFRRQDNATTSNTALAEICQPVCHRIWPAGGARAAAPALSGATSFSLIWRSGRSTVRLALRPLKAACYGRSSTGSWLGWVCFCGRSPQGSMPPHPISDAA